MKPAAVGGGSALGLTVYAFLAAFFIWTGWREALTRSVAPMATAGVILATLAILALLIAPAVPEWRTRLRRACETPWPKLIAAALFLVPYFIYALATGDLRAEALGKAAGFVFVPFAVFAVAPVRDRRRLEPQDVVALAALALPVLLGWFHGVWTKPMELDFLARLYTAAIGAWTFLILRGTPAVGYELRFDGAVARAAIVNFLAFSIIAVPLGLAIGFIAWNPSWRGLGAFGFDLLTIFLFVALLEELFFRGLLQNLLEGRLGRPLAAQAIVSLLFGLAHIQHAPFPNWRYVLLAAIAGWFYGQAWRSTRCLVASATTHALVDAVWRTWFEAI